MPVVRNCYKAQGQRIDGFSLNFLRFLGFFEEGVWVENMGVSRSIRQAAFLSERMTGNALMPRYKWNFVTLAIHFRFDPYPCIGYAIF
jgi:hypothetical protein